MITTKAHAIDRLRAIIAANIKRERTQRDLNQSALAQVAQVAVATVNNTERWEIEPHVISLASLAAIADALGVPACTLLMTDAERMAWLAAMDGTTRYAQSR